MERDLPDVIAEVTAAFEAYERALVADDVEGILAFFAPAAVRFGIADQQIGIEEQARWRRAQGGLPPGRRLKDTIIQGYGESVAVVTTLFGYPGSDVLGRQSQTWVRLPEGWRIVTAHVSEPARQPT
ncbi:nuclear transport factor 2 family protein [Actinoplanes hulinensis]|uniref:Nuclear transport factor 2 family protein n=1 Tax=Actinoplanes hulinensis TaxID=1144547 RepID=A0ABS7ATK1_9ACTN|nr:AtzH-like domain-containing protein [Actinoplanes hulinensis]MBW6432150.1 nuclear transport factor 2 family protein [Actinoplanes hulinensis]